MQVSVQAAKRRAITELLFFASVGDLRRCQRIVRLWKLKVSVDFSYDSTQISGALWWSSISTMIWEAAHMMVEFFVNVICICRSQMTLAAITTKGLHCELAFLFAHNILSCDHSIFGLYQS